MTGGWQRGVRAGSADRPRTPSRLRRAVTTTPALPATATAAPRNLRHAERKTGWVVADGVWVHPLRPRRCPARRERTAMRTFRRADGRLGTPSASGTRGSRRLHVLPGTSLNPVDSIVRRTRLPVERAAADGASPGSLPDVSTGCSLMKAMVRGTDLASSGNGHVMPSPWAESGVAPGAGSTTDD